MANVADLNLIQINNFPEVESPEDWIVVSDAAGIGYKISKENFKAFLGTVTVTAPKPIGPTDGAPELDGVYIPTVVGVYPNFGGLERLESDGYVQFIKNGSVYAKVNVPIDVPLNIPGDLYNLSSTGQKFNLSEAINATPVEARKEGLNITFLKTVGSWTQYRYVGEGLSGWGDIVNWQLVEDADEKILDYGLGSMGNSEEIIFDGNGDISSVVYKNLQGVVIRTDTYQYSTNQIIQTQTLPNGYSRSFLTNLDTLKTIRLDTAYKDLVIYPFDYYFGGNGWQYEGSATLVDGRVNLKGFPSVGVLNFITNPLKNNTLYGFLLKVEDNTLSANFILQSSVNGAFPVIATSGQNGYRKLILTSRPDTIIAKIRFQTQSAESPTGEVYFSEVRIFELRPNSQIKIDFETLTPDQLNLKYPKQ